jgi:cation diffusion facilitator CzcD-associated flavoprotein CzcO
MAEKSMIIIGAGLAGLSTGCCAQMNDYRSHIFEHHTVPGGVAATWKRQGYTINLNSLVEYLWANCRFGRSQIAPVGPQSSGLNADGSTERSTEGFDRARSRARSVRACLKNSGLDVCSNDFSRFWAQKSQPSTTKVVTTNIFQTPSWCDLPRL